MKTELNNLYVIATPIGNLNDISFNIIETLNNLDYLFCEDTRVTLKLLNNLELNNKLNLISYHKFSETKKLADVINLIKNYRCGIVSDAGYPGINDPGTILINECHKQNIKVNIIDGPTSIIHAIVQSGLNQEGFVYLGFLSRTEKEIIKQLEPYTNQLLPLIFLESIHRINETILILKKHFPTWTAYIGRELTKLHEEYIIDQVSNLTSITTKGEVILILKPSVNKNKTLNTNYLTDIKNLVDLGMKLKNACKYIANKYDLNATEIYNEFVSKVHTND